MPLPLTVSCFSKNRLVLPFRYRLTRVVPEKGPLNGCVCVCVRACVRACVCVCYRQIYNEAGLIGLFRRIQRTCRSFMYQTLVELVPYRTRPTRTESAPIWSSPTTSTRKLRMDVQSSQGLLLSQSANELSTTRTRLARANEHRLATEQPPRNNYNTYS